MPVLEVAEDDRGRPLVASALLEGAWELTAAAVGLPAAELRGLVADLFAALGFLHQRGRVHGNLRSSNVLVVEGRLKLLDALDWCPRRPADATSEPRQDLERGDPEARRLAPRAVRALRKYTRLFAIGEPRTLLATARLNRCRRGPRRVLGLLQRAVDRARALGMPFEEAWARRVLAAAREGRAPEPIYRWDFQST